MKKLLILSLMVLVGLNVSVLARVQYDSTGRHIVEDNTIRGQRRAAQTADAQKVQAAAAAKIDYENALRELEGTNLKPNHPALKK